jgi:hypothetical protein
MRTQPHRSGDLPGAPTARRRRGLLAAASILPLAFSGAAYTYDLNQLLQLPLERLLALTITPRRIASIAGQPASTLAGSGIEGGGHAP